MFVLVLTPSNWSLKVTENKGKRSKLGIGSKDIDIVSVYSRLGGQDFRSTVHKTA